jgi:hypothetical protein
VRVPAAPSTRGFDRQVPSGQTEGAGKTGCRIHPRSCAQEAHEVTTGSTGPNRLSLPSGFTTYFEFSRLTGFLATVASRIIDATNPVGRMHPRETWRQHRGARTTRLRRPGPSAPMALPDLVRSGKVRRRRVAASFVRAPADRSRESPPCDSICAPDAVASTASHRAFVTCATPLFSGETAGVVTRAGPHLPPSPRRRNKILRQDVGLRYCSALVLATPLPVRVRTDAGLNSRP